MASIVARSFAGRDLVTVWMNLIDPVAVLARGANSELRVRRCKVISPAGAELSLHTTLEESGLQEGDFVTIVPLVSPVNVFASNRSCSIAMVKEDGSVVTWLCNTHSPEVHAQLANDVKQIVGTSDGNDGAYAALKNNGSVIAWGLPEFGGSITAVEAELSQGVKEVVGLTASFVAIKHNGSVVIWGDSWFCSDDAESEEDARERGCIHRSAVQGQISSGVRTVAVTGSACAALKDDGSVVTWGLVASGGDSTMVQAQLTSGVRQVVGSKGAFAAVKEDGSVITWGGDTWCGKLSDTSAAVQSKLTCGVQEVVSTRDAFAALKVDGSVVTWGNASLGGDSSAVEAQISSGVVQIAGSTSSFAAVKDDGLVVTWGKGSTGVNAVRAELASGVLHMAASINAFVAVTEDGSVVRWCNIDEEDLD